uniref:Ig-like domain-containing protein n=1 Tax=Chrysotila carterae TaxID=13221 RepID=A0A7S4B3D1_CHRCT
MSLGRQRKMRGAGVLVLMPETRGGTSPASDGHTLSTCAPSGRSADDAQPQLAATADTAANDASAAFSAATLLSSVHARRAPRVQLLTPPEAAAAAGLETHSLRCVLSIAATQLPWNHDSSTADGAKTSLRHLQHLLQGEMTDTEFQWDDAIAAICVHSVKLTASVSRKVFELEWTYEDEALAERIVSCIQNAKSVAKRSV